MNKFELKIGLSALVLGMFVLVLDWKLMFMLVNLGLALIPLGLVYWMEKNFVWLKKRLWLLILGLVGVVLFLPNTVYLVTDLMYIDLYHQGGLIPETGVLDIRLIQPGLEGMFWSYLWFFALMAVLGLFLNYMVVRGIGVILKKLKVQLGLDMLMAGLAVLNGFGVFIGRFLRFNSWDVFVDLGAVVTELMSYLIVLDFYVFVLSVFSIQMAFYCMIRLVIVEKLNDL